jgi:ABC-type antimicrobial peptide transport system permease subunit
MALMAATGFSDGEISHLLLREHMGLLLAGVIVGMAAALVAVTPQLLSTQAAVNWAALLGLLAAEMAIGLGSCLAAVKLVLRGNLLTGLRHE